MWYRYWWISRSWRHWALSVIGLIYRKVSITMSFCIHNFSRYFSSHFSIPLTIFTVISPKYIIFWFGLFVSGGRGLLFYVDILSAILSILSATQFIALLISWTDIFRSTKQDIFPSLGFCMTSIWGWLKSLFVTRGIKLFLRNDRG